MIPKQKSIQCLEDDLQCLACKLNGCPNHESVDTFQPEGPIVNTEQNNNVIPFKLKTSRKAKSGKSQVGENTFVDNSDAQDLIVKQVLNKAIDDPNFWVDLLENGSSALTEYNLSWEAKAAIVSGDVRWVYDNVADIQDREMTFLYKRLERSI